MNLWQQYEDQGLQVIGVGTQDPAEAIFGLAKQLGLTFPVLHDTNNAVFQLYFKPLQFGSSSFPQDVLVGADGTIIWASTSYIPGEMQAAVEAALFATDPGDETSQ